MFFEKVKCFLGRNPQVKSLKIRQKQKCNKKFTKLLKNMCYNKTILEKLWRRNHAR